MHHSLCLRLGAAVLGWTVVFGCSAAVGAPQKHAILIGVTEYSNLEDATFTDWGPRNSVLLWRQLLQKRGFQDIQVLTDGLAPHVPVPGIPDLDDGITQTIPGAVLPTRANVDAALRRLEAVLASKPDASKDEVLIVLIGHGSTQPAAANDRDQPDGRNQVFLLRDSGISLDRRHYERALLDKDVRPHLQALSRKAGTVWFVFDQCFAASMTYGARRGYALPADPTRSVVHNDLGYETRPASAPSTTPDFGVIKGRPTGEKNWPSNFLAFYAVSSKDEASTIQRPPAPLDSLLRSSYPGFTALSYFMVQEIHRRPKASFRQLLAAVRQGYLTVNVLKGLTPFVEGAVTLDRSALP